MTKYTLLLAAILLLAFTSCQKDNLSQERDELNAELAEVLSIASPNGKSAFVLPSSEDYASIPQDPKNPITAEKVELGRMLYHDPSFGMNPKKNLGAGTFSCASCHFAQGGFAARKAQGIGEGGLGTSDVGRERTASAFYESNSIDVQPIKSPSTLNVAYQQLMLWNGQFGGVGVNLGTEPQWTPGTPKENNNLGFEGVETQAIAGIEVHRLKYNEALITQFEYKGYFDEAFADVEVGERYTNLTAALAIAAYERTLLPNKAPFQNWLRGNSSAMTKKQIEGAILFFGESNCTGCHTGPALSKMEFTAIGMNDLYQSAETTFRTSADNAENMGRGGFTKNEADMFKFKIPQLYNLHDSPFYGHGASFTDLFDVIKYKSIANPQNNNVPLDKLDDRFQPLGLSDDEIESLTEFVAFGLRDAELERYLPKALPSGNCFPNADALSKYEMDCN